MCAACSIKRHTKSWRTCGRYWLVTRRPSLATMSLPCLLLNYTRSVSSSIKFAPTTKIWTTLKRRMNCSIYVYLGYVSAQCPSLWIAVDLHETCNCNSERLALIWLHHWNTVWSIIHKAARYHVFPSRCLKQKVICLMRAFCTFCFMTIRPIHKS